MKKGIFWFNNEDLDNPHLITVAAECDANGEADPSVVFSAKSGRTFNHKIEWEKLGRDITGGHEFNYYPRGRVDIVNGKATIYLNPDLNNDAVLDIIFTEFELKENSELKTIAVKSDGSHHYRYYSLDENEQRKYLQQNPDEYKLNGKIHIEKIKQCMCDLKEGDEYVLDCYIRQHGTGGYSYTLGDNILYCTDNRHDLYVHGDAVKTLEKTIADYEKQVEKAKKWNSVTVKRDNSDYSIYYNYDKALDRFVFMIEYDENGKQVKQYCPRYMALNNVIHTVCGKDEWKNNIVYEAALQQKDEIFAAIIRVHYGKDSEDDCRLLSEYSDRCFLPRLPVEYKKDYYVLEDTIDNELLVRSGYDLWHQPYFSMRGFTRKGHTLNPHRKYGYDASPADAELITFEEYLKLFKEYTANS